LEITLSDEQKAVFRVMEQTRQHVFVTGRAGTGKSRLLQYFREHTRKRSVVVAPTGIAALNVRGQTIHSLFRLPPSFIQPGNLTKNALVSSFLRRIETVIIDEISMVRADLMDAIDARLRQAHNNDLPFGGAQVIMFGDLYQLPPVVDEGLIQYFEAIHGGYFFFHAHVWKTARFAIYELTQIFRQKDPVFKDLLNAVREGTVDDVQIEQLNERSRVAIPDEGVITLAATNALVSQINESRLAQLPGKVHEYKAEIRGNLERSAFPTEEELQLKVGAQIILLRNDKDGRWVNGTIGTIHALKEKEISVRVGGMVYRLSPETWEKISYTYNPATRSVEEEVISSFTQFPLRLAWAMTIHKSQGQTYQSVVLDLAHDAFAPGQLYVALSRCTSLEGLYLKTPLKRGHILVEPKITAFMEGRAIIPTESNSLGESSRKVEHT
jgi:ATP-dependent exoDNAse (exonuclease V) alpha subunit